MAGVTGGLFDEMQQNPAEREMLAVAQRLGRHLVQSGSRGDDLAGTLTGFAIAVSQLLGLKVFRSAEFPVGVCPPIYGRPRLTVRPSAEPHFHPVHGAPPAQETL